MINIKLKKLEDLGKIASDLKKQGKKIVHAHGVYDLFHVGHKRHLENGKKYGDVLFVTITTDNHVNKGPSRPVFTEILRAEMLASLIFVDYVAISPNPSAEKVISIIKPDIYLKGSEYSKEQNDITGKITTEVDTVKKYGGEVVFTNEVTFSSSNLTNRFLPVHPKEVQTYLEGLRKKVTINDIKEYIEKAKKNKALVIGDIILDEYVYVDAMGKPSKENIISTRYKEKEIFTGGVIATANILSKFCDDLTVMSAIGSNCGHEGFIKRGFDSTVVFEPIYRKNSCTTIKSRIVDSGYSRKLFEVSYIDDSPMNKEDYEKLNNNLIEKFNSIDYLVVNDFGHGLIDESIIDTLTKSNKFLSINTQTNSANRGFNLITKYKKADLICIDEPEARLATGDRFSEIDIVFKKLRERINCNTIIITHGKKGCYVSTSKDEIERVPALTQNPVDTIGAGDAFFAAVSPLIASGCPAHIASFIASALASMKVAMVGHRHQITYIEIIKYLITLLK
tara:strand:- start:10915 stop:12438 length:1524 start_codon:yes stop_codon:yes gene_type:complete